MVLFVRWFSVLPLLVVATAPATAATRNAPPYLRITLDDSAPAPAATAPAPRRIRSSLDDTTSARATVELPITSAGHAEFPLETGGAKVAGRLIRLSLDDGQATYGHLVLAQPASRRIRTSLD
jgi:hypothetical protein